MAAGEQVLRGRFELLEEIGEGGFARVFRARETTTGAKVALKVLKDGFQNDAEVLERFRREVFAVASIDSPHVVALKDFGISGDEFFIAMEFVEGPTLRDVIEQTEWSAEAIYSIVSQIADALEAAHDKNIVHRDLKPENVMLVNGPDDTKIVKVLDFGLAKLADLERNLGLAPLTRVGMCFGTPQYMSPELIYGKPVDSAVDIFALAVIAYELIAGRRPWDAAQPQEVMVAVAKTALPSIAHTHSSMAKRLDVINRFFQRALSKRKDERANTVGKLIDGLTEAMFGESRPLMTQMRSIPIEFTFIAPAPAPARPDETVLDIGPRVQDPLPPARERTSEKTTEFATENSAELSVTSTGQRRAEKLSATWIPSLASVEALDDAVETNVLTVTKTPSGAPVLTRATATSTTRPPRRTPIALLVLGLLIALVASAAIGYLIGRGR